MSQVRRRHFLIAAGAGCLSVFLPALAQQEKRVRRIGYFTGGSLQNNAAWLAAFREGMTALHWAEGKDYVIDARYANGVAQAMPGLAAELVATQPDLLLTVADTPARPLAQLTKTIPIVFAIASDPVGNRLATSLQRPGNNLTGLSSVNNELLPKRLQLLKEAFPRVAHVVLLFEPSNPGSLTQLKDIEAAAQHLKMRVTPIELLQDADLEPAFKRGTAVAAQAYMMGQGGILNAQRQAIADRIIRLKVPAIAATTEFVEAGVLMSYGPSAQDNFRRAAGYVDKIFKGAKPGDLPIEQPTKYELILNLKAAKAMGIKFPQSILVRADRVIE
jgi:putative tryptophan/tyrosine transport system substrate-binding protein